MIERNKAGRLTADSRAALAVKGMPPSDLADVLEVMETEYRAWKGVTVNEDGLVTSERWFYLLRRLVRWVARRPLEILRSEIESLARAQTKAQMNERAATAQADFARDYLKMAAQYREFRAFLREHFETDLADAEADNVALFDLAKRIMLRQKRGQ